MLIKLVYIGFKIDAHYHGIVGTLRAVRIWLQHPSTAGLFRCFVSCRTKGSLARIGLMCTRIEVMLVSQDKRKVGNQVVRIGVFTWKIIREPKGKPTTQKICRLFRPWLAKSWFKPPDFFKSSSLSPLFCASEQSNDRCI
jgi:hypothetical protein